MDKRIYRDDVALKVNNRKTFDTMKWSFIIYVFKAFNFSSSFIDHIHFVFYLAMFLVLVNGALSEYFVCLRGVCHRDPLSPPILCIAKDFLNRYIFLGWWIARSLCLWFLHVFWWLSHFLYANDTIIFCHGTTQNIKVLLQGFNFLVISPVKLWIGTILIFSLVPIFFLFFKIKNFIGYHKYEKGFFYLSFILFKGRPKVDFLNLVANHILSHFES